MLTELQKAKQSHYFYLVDVNKNGFIEPDDWANIGRNLAAIRGIPEGSEVYDGILATMGTIWENLSAYVDQDGDAKATLEEWLQFEDERVVNVEDEEFYDDYVNNIVRNVFQLMDADGDGEIGVKEYTDLMVSFQVQPRFAVEAFHKLDTDSSGAITEDELVHHVGDFHRSDDPNKAGNWLFGNWDVWG